LGTAEKVVVTLDRAGSHRFVRGAALICIVACAAIAWHAFGEGGDPEPIRGEFRASERQSVKLGRRGLAVAEAGAHLSWEILAGGAVRVEHRGGTVFYRIDPGTGFEISVFEGQATFDPAPTGERTTLSPGQRLEITTDGTRRVVDDAMRSVR